MDKFLAPHTPEAAAHIHLSENWLNWDSDHPSINETLVAGCASYRAFDRYLSGADLFLHPRNRAELESILKRYSYDVIHNTIARSRSTLQPGGYSRVCHLAEKSIRNVLNTADNTPFLLALHSSRWASAVLPLPYQHSTGRPRWQYRQAAWIGMLAYTVFIVLLYLSDVLASPVQVVLQAPNTKPRQLHGRFLQITDMHPDPYYAPHTAERTSCHRKKAKKKKNTAGYWGTPFSECDSPLRLTNFTLDFLEKEWASDVDFVIWTGDNARHDNDPKLPRTPDEIYDLNRAVARRMKDVFLAKGIPVVPSLGNNDVWPHNIMTPGPNSITNEFSRIWDAFIPFPYLQVFQRGAYFSVEVIPNDIAVISLNTMYFYDSNKAVGGCAFHAPDDPGNLQLDWLEVQLKDYRSRNMQVWISGHVPPSPGNYFPDCYVRYVELSLRFQDTVLGHLFGHMNADHFSFLEAIDLEFTSDEPTAEGGYISLYDTLLNEFQALPTKPKNLDYGDYHIVNTAPPVVPNPYLPSFRVFSYNVSGKADAVGTPKTKTTGKRRHGHRRGDRRDKEAHCRQKENQETWKCFLNDTWHSDPEAPSRTNKQWTPLGYAQYYMPHLGDASRKHPPRFTLEYLTFAPELLHPPPTFGAEHRFQYPVPLRHLPRSLRDPNVTESKYAPYEMRDLTIPSWVGLAQKLGDPAQKKLRRKFRKYMYMGGEEG
ncbi:putative calcineurin-like phosphoesterase [Lyophyllum shimeji]|uniref:Calcineurin-like phosphoesterase n=1 Tax=Lyophyllum shimeji TaxID=47721 RepID=A0A9P3UHE6_LYOSH|nr:putative calcineurin-like phosphoesterase [Lyophyllum shimeji]